MKQPVPALVSIAVAAAVTLLLVATLDALHGGVAPRDEPPAEVKVLRVKAGGWEETGDRPLTSEGEDDWWAPEDEGGSETDDIEA